MAPRTSRRFAVLTLFFSLALAPAASADQVIPDDLIVQSSGCFGFDCVDQESFGFDTLRLKENNTRIKFDDTSATAGYAANDWTLIANENPSGGRNIFMLEDTTGAKTPFAVMAGARTNALFVDQLGRIGVGTDAPGRLMHLKSGDQPGFRLEQDTSDSFTAQTWDVTGDEANFAIRDVTGGSRLPLRIRPGAPTSTLDLKPTGEVLSSGVYSQSATGGSPGTLDPADVLTKIEALPVSTFKLTGDTTTHASPGGTEFRAAFGLGNSDTTIAPGDVATVSLLGVQALSDRVDSVEAAPLQVSGRLDTLTQQLGSDGERIKGAEDRLGALDTRVGGAEGRLSELLKAVEPLGLLSTRVTQLAAFDTTADKRLTALEKQNKSLASTNKKLSKRLRAIEKKMKRR